MIVQKMSDGTFRKKPLCDAILSVPKMSNFITRNLIDPFMNNGGNYSEDWKKDPKLKSLWSQFRSILGDIIILKGSPDEYYRKLSPLISRLEKSFMSAYRYYNSSENISTKNREVLSRNFPKFKSALQMIKKELLK